MVDPFKLIETEVNGIKLSIPIIVQELFEFIYQDIVEGIFRINGSMKKFNYYYTNLSRFNKWLPTANVYDICSLLKKVLLNNFKFFQVDQINLNKLFGNTPECPNENQITNFNWNYFNHILNNQVKDINLNVFIYSINYVNNFLQFNKLTKMTNLNFAIIFQPIFFPCDNLILLPHYINLLKHLLENRSKILINKSLINEKMFYNTNLLDPELDSNTFFYKFKNFKNKSIDSINLPKKVPLNDYFKYSKFGKSVESLPVDDIEDLNNNEGKSKSDHIDNDADDGNKDESSLETGIQKDIQKDNSSEYNDSISTNDPISDSKTETLSNKEPSSETRDSSDFDTKSSPSKKPTLPSSKTFHSRDELYHDDSFHSLDPLELASPTNDHKNTDKDHEHRYGTQKFKHDDTHSVDPLEVDPEVDELVQLKDVNTKSFQFDMDFNNSSNSSFHSIVNTDTDNDFERDIDFGSLSRSSSQLGSNDGSNRSNLTNDTSFRIDQLDNDINFNSGKDTRKSSSASSTTAKKRYSSANILTNINTLANPTPNVASVEKKRSPTRQSNSSSNSNKRDHELKRSSRILTKLESKLSLDPTPSFVSTSSPIKSSSRERSTTQPLSQTSSLGKRSSIIDNGKNFVNMFKNENPKRNFTLKLKSKGVF